MMRWASVWLLLAVLVAWWWSRLNRRQGIPDVKTIQRAQLSFEELTDIVREHAHVEDPTAYATFLYRRAYGRNPGGRDRTTTHAERAL